MLDIEMKLGFNPAEYEIVLEDGTKYLPFAARVLWFRTEYPDGKILSSIVDKQQGSVVFETKIYKDSKFDESNFVSNGFGTGYFNADDLQFGNKFYEKAETSSVVRALIKVGIGIGYRDDTELENIDIPKKNEEKMSNDFKKDGIPEPEITTKNIIENNKANINNNVKQKNVKNTEKKNKTYKEPKKENNSGQSSKNDKEPIQENIEELTHNYMDNDGKNRLKSGKRINTHNPPENDCNAKNEINPDIPVYDEVFEEITEPEIDDEVITLIPENNEEKQDIITLVPKEFEEPEICNEENQSDSEEFIIGNEEPEFQSEIEKQQIENKTSYNKSTDVDEIVKSMTYDEAMQTVVNNGYFKGSKIEHVYKTSPASLAWFLSTGNKSDDNIVRAAAKIVISKATEKVS